MTPQRQLDCALRWAILARTLSQPADRSLVYAVVMELVDKASEQR